MNVPNWIIVSRDIVIYINIWTEIVERIINIEIAYLKSSVIINEYNTKYMIFIIYIDMFCFGCFRLSEYEADYSQNFETTKYVAVYGDKTFSISLCLLGMLEHPLFKPFPNFHRYNNI